MFQGNNLKASICVATLHYLHTLSTQRKVNEYKFQASTVCDDDDDDDVYIQSDVY